MATSLKVLPFYGYICQRQKVNTYKGQKQIIHKMRRRWVGDNLFINSGRSKQLVKSGFK